MDKIFLQFYNYRFSYTYASVCLNNGFSSAFNVCKNKGDFTWLKAQTYVEGEDSKDPQFVEAPIKKGTIYASCFYVLNVYQCYLWAMENPKLKIVCGGPAIGNFTYDQNAIPKNLQFVSSSVEEYFGQEKFSGEWGLEAPLDKIHSLINSVYFSIEIEEHCYHGKCIFCNLHELQNTGCKQITGNELKNTNIPNNYKKIVWLHSPSIKPDFLRTTFLNFPKDNYLYYVFIRSDKKINDTLVELYTKYKEQVPDTVYFLGIDFIGNRMLKYINKGFTMEDSFETLKILREYNVKTTLSTIVRWPNLTEEDYKEAEKYVFHEEIQKCKSAWVLGDLTVRPNTSLMNDKQFQGKPLTIGPFFVARYPTLNKKQEQINNRIRELLAKNIPGAIDRKNRIQNQPFSF